MGKVVFAMTMSVDGLVNDRDGADDQLYPDFAALGQSELKGRWTFDMPGDSDWYAGNYEFQLPIFVVTDLAPERAPKQTADLTFTFVTDGVESALTSKGDGGWAR
jgi:hypothetical protein